MVAGCDPKKKAEEIDAEAGRRADVLTRHRKEWVDAREILGNAMTAHKKAVKLTEKKFAFEDLRATKITAESTAG